MNATRQRSWLVRAIAVLALAGGCNEPPDGAAADASAAVDAMPTADARPALYPDGYLEWGTFDGFYGYGNWLVVTGDGRIGRWGHVVENVIHSFPPSWELTVSTELTDELFARWADTDVTGLPHTGTPDNWPILLVARLCATCEETTLRYDAPEQVHPELDSLAKWFEMQLPDDWKPPNEW